MPDASHDFGAHLRQAREQRGITLHQIAARTKISVLVLEALERNDVSRLPGGIFTRAFVRAYAGEVGLDPEDTVRRFLARFPDESTEEGPKPYEANPEHIEVDEPPTFGRAWRAVAWSIPLLLVVGYFGFGGRQTWWGDRAAQQPAARASETPAVPPPPPAAAASQPALPTPSTEVAGQAPAPAPMTSPAGEAPSPAAQPPAAAGQVPAAVQAAVPASTPGPVPAGGFRLSLAPTGNCWVSVRSNGTSIFSGLMKAGERKDLVVTGDVSLSVGNAGEFAFSINDQPARSLGGPGQVATIHLNADNLKTFLESR